MIYRKDIQILRGLAVLLVVLFHLGISGFHSGFLGVDVFFVISGFLMAVLYSQNEKKLFFRKRAFRLLPAYFVTIISTVLAATVIVTPNEFNQVFNQSIYADVFASNIGYWMKNSYFSKAEFNPLLHLWSLGVEIQYYLIIPILFFLFRKSKLFFWVIFSCSIVSCFKMVEISPKTSFFMMPMRLWEFLIGYFIAKFLTTNGNIKTTPLRQNIGSFFFLVILAIPLFEVKESFDFITGHPGFIALGITISTGIVLAFGVNNQFEKSPFGTLLELIGKYSYSIYLVHYPIIVLYLYEPFSGTNIQINNINDLIYLIIFISIASYVMHDCVETKLRYFKKTRFILLIFPISIILITGVGYGLQRNIMYSNDELLIFDSFKDRDTYRCGKIFRFMNPGSITCEITENNTNSMHNIMLLGNSHADSIKTAFAHTASLMGTGLFFLVPNNPLMNNSNIDSNDVVTEAIKHDISTIVMHYSNSAISVSEINKLVTVAQNNNILVSFIMPVPVWKQNVPKALWENHNANKPLQVQTKKDYQNKTGLLKKDLLDIKSTNFRLYEVDNYFCNEACAIVDSLGKPLYFDSGHLTLTGSNKLLGLFEYIINDSKSYKKRCDSRGI